MSPAQPSHPPIPGSAQMPTPSPNLSYHCLLLSPPCHTISPQTKAMCQLELTFPFPCFTHTHTQTHYKAFLSVSGCTDSLGHQKEFTLQQCQQLTLSHHLAWNFCLTPFSVAAGHVFHPAFPSCFFHVLFSLVSSLLGPGLSLPLPNGFLGVSIFSNKGTLGPDVKMLPVLTLMVWCLNSSIHIGPSPRQQRG